RPVKGITKAMEALAPLVNNYPSLSLLLAGGDLDPSYSAVVREMASRMSWVDMLGEVPHHRMGEIISSSDLVLNCSFFEGGMANSILEAMIMGKPVLARNVLGNRSLISHGVNGWLYNSDHELREFLLAILDNPELGVKTGAAGRKYVQERFSVTSEARSYRQLYEQVIDGFSKTNARKIQHS
ncbi:MAG: glycosyltransferase, partial [Deltaproteobacteria bacterium]|nr:glycosyltransferase [Deltaproteobacteria bacterium]